jgi:hypothetical protein
VWPSGIWRGEKGGSTLEFPGTALRFVLVWDAVIAFVEEAADGPSRAGGAERWRAEVLLW